MNIQEEVHECAMGIFFCDEQDGEREAWQPFEDWDTEDIMTEVRNTADWIRATVDRIVESKLKEVR
jgi:hypothetical protein